ncbi:hypothetical protein D3C80_254570 [compost metagenome]
MSCVSRDLDVITQGVVAIAMTHDPRFRICRTNAGLALAGARIARALGYTYLLGMEKRLLKPFYAFATSPFACSGLPDCCLPVTRISHRSDMISCCGQMLDDLRFLLERAWPRLRSDFRTVMHDALQSDQTLCA